MKNKTFLIIISLFLSYTNSFSQIEKHKIVVVPQIYFTGFKFDNSDTKFNTMEKRYFRSSFQYFFNSKLSIGFLFDSYTKNKTPSLNSTYDSRKENTLIFSPIFQYNFLKTKFTPFLRLKLANVNYTRQTRNNPNLTKIQNFAEIIDINFLRTYENSEPIIVLPAIGFNYSINKRVGFSCYYEPNSHELPSRDFSTNKIFIGLQIVCN